jgi:hypothetical protein
MKTCPIVLACAVLLCLLILGCDGGGGTPPQPMAPPQQAAPPPPTPLQGDFKVESRGYWDIAQTSEYAIIIPRNWSQVIDKDVPEASTLYLVKRGVIDETGNPVEVGLMIERFPSPERTVDEEIDRLIVRYRQLEQTELITDPLVQNVQLAGGASGQLLLLEMLTQGKVARRSSVVKLLTADENNTTWIVTGYVASGHESIIGTPQSNIFQMLLTHVSSFSLDPQTVDEQPIHEIYHAQAMPPAQQPQ